MLALTALTLLAAGCGGGSSSGGVAQAGADAPRGRDWRAFGAWIERRAAAGRFSGAVLVARRGRPVLMRAAGLADRERGTANTVHTRFNVGSVGKTFTAVAIAQLVERGKLSFDDPIGRYVSGFPPAIARTVTIAQLLTHTSGLGDLFMRWHPTGPSPLPVSHLMERVVVEPPLFRPGSRFGYGNSGFVVLGAIVEAVTGRDYYDHVRRHVLRPAGMTRTGWYTLDRVPGMAHGYVRVDRNGVPVPQGPPPPGAGPPPGRPVGWQDTRGEGGAGNPSGGAYSTVGDLARFARALQQHRLLGPRMTDVVLGGKVDTGRPGPAQVSRYGYGFEDERLDGVRIVGHGGGVPGVEAQLRIYPELGHTVIVLANQDGAATPVYERANELLTGRSGPRRRG